MTDPRPAGAEPYEALASLIERELALVGERDLGGLEELRRARGELLAALPPTPPAEAGPALERCRLLGKRLEIELERVREALLAELRQVSHAQRAAAGYAPARRDGRRIVAHA